MKSFFQLLRDRCHRCGNPVLVGLDPRVGSLPPALRPTEASPESVANAYRTFCKTVIDVVAPLVPAVKPQAAFFEQIGPPGGVILAEIIRYAQSKGLLVILDGKRNDIGSTATAYADGLLGRESPWGADALTVSPYLGEDSVTPFLQVASRRNAGIFVLVRTSNPGGTLIQDLSIAGQTDDAGIRNTRTETETDPKGKPDHQETSSTNDPSGDVNLATLSGRTVYERVGNWVNRLAESSRTHIRYSDTVGAVVGATYPDQLARLRTQMKATWLLVPGFGAQGGSVADVAGAFDENGEGALINNSRGILFAYQKPEYAEFGPDRWERAVEAATRDMIDSLRDQTLARRLGDV